MSVLMLILVFLWQEERRLRKNITHGMANKFWILRERRRYVRFDEEIKIRYHLKDKPSGLNHTKTANISKKGLCLLTYEKLKEKTFLDMEMDVPRFSKPIRVTGHVVWTKDLQARDAQGRRLFYIGIRFARINPESESVLLTHLGVLKPDQL